ncbi:MAG: helix-turn-helix domain-containing protein [Chloroflexota bacterium]|nr:helix-turn-helix domain-containing protein [Chloroflexota bacterium]
MDEATEKAGLADVVGAAEAAAMLGVTRQHAVHLFNTGQLPGRRLTATWVTTRQAVEEYARTRRGPGRPRRQAGNKL